MMGIIVYLSIQIPGILIFENLYGIYGIAAALVFAETSQAIFFLLINRIKNNNQSKLTSKF